MLKKIAKIALGLIAVILIVPMFLSAHFSLTRSIEINAPTPKVYARLLDLNTYAKWNPFPEGDPTNQNRVSGEGLNSSMEWKGDKTGEGKMTIVGAELDKKITVKMEFYKPMRGDGVVAWTTRALSDKTTEVTWIFEQNLPYLNRYFGLFMDAMMGKHFEKGLQNFKAMME